MSSLRPPNPLPSTNTTAISSPSSSTTVGLVDLAYRTLSHCSLTLDDAAAAGPVAELPSLSLSPSASSPFSLTDPFNTVDKPRLSRRPSRKLPSFITRLSGGASTTTDTSVLRPFWQWSAEGAHKLHRRVPDSDERPREKSDYRGARALRGQQQPLYKPNSVAESHRTPTPQSTTTTPPSSQQSTDSSSDLKDSKCRQPASTVTTPPNTAHSKQVDDVVDPNCKMHQTSSRLLRMTDDDRPFTRVSIFLHATVRRNSMTVLCYWL